MSSASVWLAGAMGVLHARGILLLLVVGMGACLGLARAASLPAWRELFADTRAVWMGLSSHRSAGVVVTLIGTVLAARQWLHIVTWPPHNWDVLTYHMPKVAEWIQYERLVALPTPTLRSYWPASFELMQTWYAVFLHHDVIVEAAGLP